MDQAAFANLKDVLSTITPLIGVVVGGMLTGFTALLKARDERKRLIASALSDLLEVRHRIVSIDLFVKDLRERKGIQAEVMPVLRQMLDSVLPAEPEANARYDKAVTMLAGIDPVLGFTLRSKNLLPGCLAALRAKALAEGVSLADFEALEFGLRAKTMPSLDAAVLELGRSHSRSTHRRVKGIVAKSSEISADMAALVDHIKPEQGVASAVVSQPANRLGVPT